MSNSWELRAEPLIDKFDRYAALSENWAFSRDFLLKLSKHCDDLSDNVVTIGIAGSFGRLEGSRESDSDYIIIVKDEEANSIKSDQDKLNAAIKALGVSPPNKTGVFSAPRSQEHLIGTFGTAEERVDEFGKRLLILLETRPVYRAEAYDQLLEAVFVKYSEDVAKEGGKEFTFLTNDLIRYFRFICVNYQDNFWRQNEHWALRNLKLRHSRIIMYAGLLFLLGEASKYQFKGTEKIDIVRDRFSLTPLERIDWVYKQNNDSSISRVLGLYNVFVARLSDSDWRQRLQDLDYAQRYSRPEFAELKANSDALISELTRFVFARRGQWSDRFFEYLFF